MVPVHKIKKNPRQPRQGFEEDALRELADSIRLQGVLQPVLLRQVGDLFELIAGERRWRAAQMVGLAEIPALLHEATDIQSYERATIENLQRSDLNPIEEAENYRGLMTLAALTQEEVARRLGRARATVANALRLLDLPNRVKQLVAENQLSAGHAKVLLGLEIGQEQELLAARVVGEGLSVRALEHVINRLKKPAKKARSEKSDIPEGHLKYLTDKLHQHMGTAVRISPSRTLANGKKVKGTVEIDFYSNDDLDRLLVILGLVDNI